MNSINRGAGAGSGSSTATRRSSAAAGGALLLERVRGGAIGYTVATESRGFKRAIEKSESQEKKAGS